MYLVGLPTEPILTIGCYDNDECPLFNACENKKCINPCAERNPCAPTATCKVINHEPECTCPDGFIGSPLTDCRPRKLFFFLPSFIFQITLNIILFFLFARIHYCMILFQHQNLNVYLIQNVLTTLHVFKKNAKIHVMPIHVGNLLNVKPKTIAPFACVFQDM